MLPKAKLWLGLVIGAVTMWSTTVQAAWELNMPRGVTQISRDTYDLHMQILWWCVAIGVIVFGAMLFSIIFHRKSRGAVPSDFHESVKMEVTWTIIPFIILIIMAIPSTRVLTQIYDSSDSEIDIEVVGYQWRWQYRYLPENPGDEEVSFFSAMSTSREEISNDLPKEEHYLLDVDNPMVIPINTKVRLLLTANDVIHSWWVPEFAVKKDAIPGFINESWTIVEEPGIYRGQCAELCGVDHGFMPVVVHAVEREEYDRWYAEQQDRARTTREMANNVVTMDEAMSNGEAVYTRTCVACHQATGAGMPPVFPALAGSDVVTGDLDVNMDIVLNGVPGTAMPAFRNQLNPIELAAVMTYIRNAWGNNTGDLIQPSEVNAILQEGQ